VQADMMKNHVVIYSDSTVAAPIVFSYALSMRKPRKQKRLMDRLDSLYAKLKRAHEARHPGSDAMLDVGKATRKSR
jgi:deoxyhypusine synthase